MSTELNKRKKAFDESAKNLKQNIAIAKNLASLPDSIRKTKLLIKAKKQSELDLKEMVKRRLMLTSFCERAMLPIPEDSLKVMLEHNEIIEKYEMEFGEATIGGKIHVRTRCCYKLVKQTDAVYKHGVGVGGWYCVKKKGCTRQPASERPDVDLSQKVWKCKCYNETYTEVENINISKFGFTVATVVKCKACGTTDKIFLTKYNKKKQ